MNMLPNKPPKRAAVYTRKSCEEGLDQEYNSIDAQRDAGQSFIASQFHEGWIPVADNYDDPAFSGGSMNRPGLQRLMADIVAGKINIVVVYKIDRLTRSLADFSKMIEVFDQHSVSFVAVTQQFNTTNSMGKLTLNILLSFSQFEREIAGERIRDKIAASKAKGIFMGGYVPWGYDAVDRKMIINPTEAEIVRRIFSDFVKCQSCTELSKQLNAEGITTKARPRNGELRPGNPIDKKFLAKLLQNQIYIGKIQHRGTWFAGQHEAIIPPELWAEVEAILAADSRQRGTETQALHRTDVLLRGILFTPSGEKMHPTFTRKSGRQYVYYVSQSEQRFGAAAKTYDRLPANVVDEAVLSQVKSVLSCPEATQAIWHQLQGSPEIDDATAATALGRLGDIWDWLFPAEKHRIVHLMVERVDLVAEGISVSWRKLGWKELISEFTLPGKKLLEAA